MRLFVEQRDEGDEGIFEAARMVPTSIEEMQRRVSAWLSEGREVMFNLAGLLTVYPGYPDQDGLAIFWVDTVSDELQPSDELRPVTRDEFVQLIGCDPEDW